MDRCEGVVTIKVGRTRRLVVALGLVGLLTACAAAGDPAGPATPRPVVTLAAGGVALPETVQSPSGTECPGYSLSSPTPAHTAGSGSYGQTIVLEDRNSVNISCLGPVRSTGSVEEVAGEPWSEDTPDAPAGTRSAAVTVLSAYGEALRVDTTFTSNQMLLTEWFIERSGYVFGVGYLRPVGSEDLTSTVEAMLSSWRWA